MTMVEIDLGTTNSLVTVWRNGKSELIPNATGGYLTPSVSVLMRMEAFLWDRQQKNGWYPIRIKQRLVLNGIWEPRKYFALVSMRLSRRFVCPYSAPASGGC